MKKRVHLALLAMLIVTAMLMAAACADSTPAPVPSPSPETKLSPSPMVETPIVEVEPTTGLTPGEAIEGFVEGSVVEVAKLPEKVTAAIKKEYADAAIKSASYATYENKQTYKVVIQQGKDEATQEVYVTADGQIIPAKATAASPSPAADGTNAPAAGLETGK